MNCELCGAELISEDLDANTGYCGACDAIWEEKHGIKSEPLAAALVSEDVCPNCLGELDTGWECNTCGFDAVTRRPGYMGDVNGPGCDPDTV